MPENVEQKHIRRQAKKTERPDNLRHTTRDVYSVPITE